MKKWILQIFAITCLATLGTVANAESAALPKYLTEEALVASVGLPVSSKVKEEDSPGCMVTRYKFSTDDLGVSLEFKCKHTNVAWIVLGEEEYKDRVKSNVDSASRAVKAITGGSGIEVEQVMNGQIYRGKKFSNGLRVNGGCGGSLCLLTFSL
ncbi:MAG: hypothetical protein ABWY06_19955 [Pseudomonas sp.]|uniref:hypothetical protein n=1 Tax=Pseudomonas sp. TaxID=306 RepID=UPI0033907E79